MREDELRQRYFEWMYETVTNDRYSRRLSYWKLFEYLDGRDFTWTIPMDANRAEDGIDLRYRFGRENGYSQSMIASMLDVRPCSILEMMIALCIRCEEAIMSNTEYGDRTGQWFWEMIVNLGLGHMDDRNFDEDVADRAVYILENRKYRKNGEGGLFKVNDRSKDMRVADIWYQMNWHMDEVLRGESNDTL